jgi:hypothetical protein
MKAGNLGELDRIISVLDQLALSPNGNSRNGGLIGLAATAIALGKVFRPIYLYSFMFFFISILIFRNMENTLYV